MSDDSNDAGQAPFSAYTASLRPLKGPGSSAGQLLQARTGAGLAAESLAEQFERAHQYVQRHQEDFSAERLESLQVLPCRHASSQRTCHDRSRAMALETCRHAQCSQNSSSVALCPGPDVGHAKTDVE
jgi:hypothetical protein